MNEAYAEMLNLLFEVIHKSRPASIVTTEISTATPRWTKTAPDRE
jgi:hypothetical protein